MEKNYCELYVDGSGHLPFLTTFNRTLQEELLDDIKQVINIISTVLPGKNNTAVNCDLQHVSYVHRLTVC